MAEGCNIKQLCSCCALGYEQLEHMMIRVVSRPQPTCQTLALFILHTVRTEICPTLFINYTDVRIQQQ